MANNTINTKDHTEYTRVFDTVSREEFNEAREFLEHNPRKFYAQLVALLWNTEDWEVNGEDFEEDDIVRDIFDTIQGIAARDAKGRRFTAVCKGLKERHPEWSKEDILSIARV